MSETHCAARILEAVRARLEPVLPGKVHPNRVRPLAPDDLPAVIVRMGEDKRIASLSAREVWALQVEVLILVAAQVADLDGETLALRLAITRALRTEDRLGLPFVRDVDLSEQSPSDVTATDEGAGAVTALGFSVEYQVNPFDPV